MYGCLFLAKKYEKGILIVKKKKKESQFAKHGVAHVDGRVACMNFSFKGRWFVCLYRAKCLISHPKLAFG